MLTTRSRALSAGRLFLTGAAMALSSCATGGSGSGTGEPTEVDFAPELGIYLSQMTQTPDGLYFHDLEVGTGEEA